ncbi:TRAP transporter substrate-binding protein [Nesterenkonia lutea]|uniref:Tripartite ATP-independent transporter DctP family solute receptor n=1 Tax=Nesterenkonia lutea TaxID=272919 RepID=A0ABR9JCK6_9MICC|nr:TRAP transporter substrate-binding protein [Nesterenkonia lutea]MBE1523673.1 tripartite ATP-independent transporter DctP family solute receptor [Nesterenkonia lutea]
MKTNGWIAMGVAGVVALSMTGCGERGAGVEEDSAAEGESYTLSIGHSQKDTTPMNLGAERFAETVSEESDGRITVEVYPAEQIGSEPEMMEGLAMNSVNIAIVATAVLADVCEEFGAFALPYAIEGETDRDQYESLRNLAGSDWNQQTIDECAESSGNRVVDNSWWYGNRNLTTGSTEVSSPEDMEGLAIRTPPADLHTMAIQDFGADAQPMPFSEVYTALDTGVIDGQENPISTIYQNSLFEVQDNLSLTKHMTQNQAVVMDDEFFSGLSDEDQEIILQAIDDAGQYQSDLQLTSNEEELELLRDEGMTVTEPDLEAFRAATEDSVRTHLEDLGISPEELSEMQQ